MSRYLSFVEQHFSIYTLTEGKNGQEALVLCCWHGDRKPSMYVNTRIGQYYCHACGAKGHVSDIAEHLGADLLDTGVSAGSLRSRLNAHIATDVATREAKRPPESFLGQFRFDHDYWASERRFTPSTTKRFQLGYSYKSNRLTIPLRDSHGELIGVIYRKLDDGPGPKYVYPKGVAIGKCLFGSWEVRDKISKVALVEGSLDAIACWDARVPALGLLGARLTNDQVRLLKSMNVKSVVVMTDNDNAGRTAIPQIKEAVSGIIVSVGIYRPYWTAKDPGELSPEQRRKMFHSAVPWRKWVAKHP